MTAERDRRFMALALSLAGRAIGNCWPNPGVGCVIARQDRVIARGWTQPGGRPHAEAMALAAAGEAARGATAYVTLEPCAHHGRTPPCAEALAAAGVTRVVSALTDPDPRVAGRGHAILRSAGIDVAEDVMAEEARARNAGFLSRLLHGRPMLTLKLAASFDGRIATATGESRWITGPEARRRVHALRARHDAVMVGGGTARADDPLLTVRGLGIARQPLRIVASRHLDLPLGALAGSLDAAPLWLFHGPGAPDAQRRLWSTRGARLFETAATDAGLDPGAILAALGAEGLTRVFCEGGGAFGASLLAADLVDELIGFTAGLVLGAAGRPGVGHLPPVPLAEARRFSLVEALPVGADVMHLWRRIR